MKHKEYVDYFRTLAIEHKDILHDPANGNVRFCRFNVSYNELLNGLKNKINLNFPCLALESYEGKLEDNYSDNKRNRKTGAFYLIKKVKTNDPDHEDEILDKMEELMLQVIARIRKDALAGNTVVKHIDLNTISYQKAGPMADNAFGWRVSFEFNESANPSLAYDASKWNQ